MGIGQRCPICSVAVKPYARYPRYLCGNCAEEACGEDGRPLVFFNVDISGGYRAEYADTQEPYASHECFVRSVRCWADEARFGGIVIQAKDVQVDQERGSRAATSIASPAPALADRARGVLVGMAVGDALGAPVEFEPPDAIRGRREELFALPGGGAFDWAPGEFTDDTQMALVLAYHLRARGGHLDADELAREFAHWAEDAADVGNQTRTVLSGVSLGMGWEEATRRLSPEAAGNGSLMRVAPVALAAASGERAAALGLAQSQLTHPNDTCLDACAFFSRLLWATVETGAIDVEGAASGIRTEAVRRAVEASSVDAEPDMSGWVLHTLTAALWAVRGASSFKDAIWRAVARGRDADTVGAVTGALAGARWGLRGIPPSLAERLQSHHPLFHAAYPAALIQLADDLVATRASV
jgi:ADP-ribosylglycohydrolase